MGPIVIIYNETHQIDSERNLLRDYYVTMLLRRSAAMLSSQFGHAG